MKLFMGTNPIDLTIVARIENDDGRWIELRGVRCDDKIPIYGCKFNEGEEERLKHWVIGLDDSGY